MFLILIAAIFLLGQNISYTQGELDNSFGINGKVTTNITPAYDEFGNTVLIQNDGKIIVSGYAYNGPNSHSNFNVIRYNADGTIDKTFGFGGKVSTDFNNSYDLCFAATIQKDGKILLAGYTYGSSFNEDFAIVRYNTNGTLDTGFGTNGKTTTDFGSTLDEGDAIAIQKDGKIVVGGYAYDGTNKGFALARYDSTGHLDPTFDNDGKVINNFGNGITALLIQDDQKIVATGVVNNGSNNVIAVVRYNSDGSLDGTFGTGGVAYGNYGSSSSPTSIVIQPNDNKIVVAGSIINNNGNSDFAVVRFTSDGKIDLNFGSNGLMRTDFDVQANSNDIGASVALQSDGKIIVAGSSQVSGSSSFAVARYNVDGTIDNSFGTNGKEKIGFNNADGHSVAVKSAGNGEEKIIIAGRTSSSATGYDFALEQLNQDGALDNSFGSGGEVETDLGNSFDISFASIIDSDGKLILAGNTNAGDHNNLAMVRYNVDGTPDTSFDHTGKVIMDDGSATSARAIAIVDNKIFVAGNYNNGSNNDFLLRKFNSDGTRDNSFTAQGGDISGGEDFATSIAIQDNKKMIVAGYVSGTGTYDFGVVRYNVDGSLDLSFNSTGIVTTDFGNSDDRGTSVVIQKDQKIIVAGNSFNGSNHDFALVRYNTDGSRDNNFGSNGDGKVTIDIQNSDDYAQSVLVQPDGKIVIVGYSNFVGSLGITMVRFDSTGVIDNSFGTNGKVITLLNNKDIQANSAVIESDGKIIVAGILEDNSINSFLLARYNTDGNLDNSFGTNGIASIKYENSNDAGAYSVLIQSDGKIVASGYSNDGFSFDFAALRYKTLYPLVQLSSLSLQFGDVFIDSSSIKSFFIKNTGSSSLNVDSIISTDNVFTISKNNFSVASGDSQKIDITFTPLQAQNYSEKLLIYSNVSGSPDTLTLTGNGITNTNLQPAINLSVNEINFGTITVNNNISKNLVVKNTGSALLKIDSITIDKNVFTVDTVKFDISAGDSLILKITFIPKDTVAYNGILKIYHNANGSPGIVNLSGKGTNQKVAIITLSTEKLNFGDVTINNSSKMNFIIGNSGTSDLHVDSIVSSNRIFIADPVNFAVKPDSGREVTVTFSPVDSINYNGTLKVYHNVAGNPSTINLTGSGVSPNKAIIKLSSSSLAFGNVMINTSKALTLNIQNTGKANLNIDSLKSNSSNFVVDESGFIVKPDSIKDVSVVFTPKDSIAYSGFLNIYHNASGNISTVSLSGKGINLPKAIISISTEALSFGDLVEGSNVTLNFNIKNNGLADLVVDSIRSNINVFTVSPTNFIIKPDSDKSILVTFSPQDSITYSGKISIYTNILGNPAVIDVSGGGFLYPTVLSVNQTINFGNVTNIDNYRMIGIPGNSNIAVSSLTQGDYQYDWNVYDDNGNAQDYLVTNSNFKFTAGKAYWLISGNTININQQITTVQLNSDNTYSIPLHSSWNLISDPFEKDITWQNVQNLNGLPGNSVLYYWNGSSFSNPSLMIPFQGYYFNNTGNLTELKLHYEPHQNAGKISKVNASSVNTKDLLGLTVSDGKINQTSEVFFGIDSLSKEGIDNYDYFAPPADFQKVRINIIKNELPAREKYLFVEQRPEIKDGQEFELEIKTVPNEPITVAVDGITNFNKYNIYLLDERLKNLYNLKEDKTFKLNLPHQFNNFRLIIGTDEYLNQIKKQLTPADYQLYQNYPNPFNPTTVIRFSILKQENISLKVYNILGQLVKTLIENQTFEAGNHEIEFNGSDLASGVYIFRLESANFISQKKMVLIK